MPLKPFVARPRSNPRWNEASWSQPNTDHRVIVHIAGSAPIELGTVTTNNRGSAEVTFSTTTGEGRPFSNALPAGKTVNDFDSIEIQANNAPVLRGTF
jgi:hypothetical protein